MRRTSNIHVGNEKCIKSFRKLEGKRPLGKCRHRWREEEEEEEDMDLKELGCKVWPVFNWLGIGSSNVLLGAQ
jgi:hypothetical protein